MQRLDPIAPHLFSTFKVVLSVWFSIPKVSLVTYRAKWKMWGKTKSATFRKPGVWRGQQELYLETVCVSPSILSCEANGFSDPSSSARQASEHSRALDDPAASRSDRGQSVIVRNAASAPPRH